MRVDEESTSAKRGLKRTPDFAADGGAGGWLIAGSVVVSSKRLQGALTSWAVQMIRWQTAEFEAGSSDAMASREAVALTQSGPLNNRYDSLSLLRT
jgi:hypothetical protein